MYTPPLSIRDVEATEQRLGLSFPTLLREFYLYVANGGCGPDDGAMSDGIIFNLITTTSTRRPATIETVYTQLQQARPHNPLWRWPRALLPFCDWGCGMLSCVDCEQVDHPLVLFDANCQVYDQPAPIQFAMHSLTLVAWVAAWIAGQALWYEMSDVPRPSRVLRLYTTIHDNNPY